MSDVKELNLWELLETPPANCEAVANLIEWSMNYDLSTGTPYHIFLDLIGYSGERYGANLFAGDYSRVIGYMEADYLADALKEYATNPRDVEAFIDAISEADE